MFLWLLALICLAALILRVQGIHWPKLHPDEYPIGSWMTHAADDLYLKDRVYANGFIQMARPFVWLYKGIGQAQGLAAYWTGAIERPLSAPIDGIMMARWFNVWLGMFTCIPIFLLARRLTQSPWMGLFAAALVGWTQYTVEHSHYGESDIPMLFALSIALWLLTVAIDTRRPIFFYLSTLACGFAAGTKFPLMILSVVVVAMAFNHSPLNSKPWTPGRSLYFAALSLASFALGFLIANPAVVFDTHWFLNGLAHEKQRVFKETALNLGILKNQPLIKYQSHLNQLADYVGSLGAGWMALALTGFWLAFLRPYRRYWTLLILFPAGYTFYWIVSAPWVRTQEFMNFLPSLALLAALPLITLWRSNRIVLRGLAIALALLALSLNAANGWRVASIFSWKDTRPLAAEWVYRHAPALFPVAAEQYATDVLTQNHDAAIEIKKIEKQGLAVITNQGCRYVLRTASIHGRGLRHPLTGELYPEPQKKFDAFLAHSERLCAWSTLPPEGQATFLSPSIELYGIRPSEPRQRLTLPLVQPAWVGNRTDHLAGRQTFFYEGYDLGGLQGVMLDRMPRVMAIGGPLDSAASAPILVITTYERPTEVSVKGWFSKQTVPLAPYDLKIIPLPAPRHGLYHPPFETLTLTADSHPDVTYIPCFVRMVWNLNEAARLCLNANKAPALFQVYAESNLCQRLEPALLYRLAVQAGRWELADRLEPTVIPMIQHLDHLLSASPDSIALRSCSSYFYDDFARIRLLPADIKTPWFRDAATGEALIQHAHTEIRMSLRDHKIIHAHSAGLTLPVLTAYGRYTVRGEWIVAKTGAPDKPVSISVQPCGSRLGLQTLSAPARATWQPFAIAFEVGPERLAQFDFTATLPLDVHVRRLELTWTLNDMMRASRDELTADWYRHQAARQGASNLPPAMAEAFRQPPDFPWANYQRRLWQMEHERATHGPTASNTLTAATQVLDLAPNHAGARLLSRASGAPPATAATPSRPAATFGDRLCLLACAFNARDLALTLTITATQDNPPPSALSVWIKRRGTWRKKQTNPIDGLWDLKQGEQLTRAFTLQDSAFKDCLLENIGIGLQSNVRWHAGDYPLHTGADYVVPLTDFTHSSKVMTQGANKR